MLKKKKYLQQSIPNPYFKQRPNINKIIEKTKTTLDNNIKPKLDNNIKLKFQKPKTEKEWRDFHKINEEGMKKAYEKPEGYHIEGNKLFIAGTRDFNDVMDWYKIPLGKFRDSKIYKNIEPIYKDNPQIDYVVGHSAGGSAALELEKNYPNRKITSITYNAPIFETGDPNSYFDENKKPMRFAVSGDPVSMFDINARTTMKAPEINLESIKNIGNVIANPTFDNINKVIQQKPDPTLGLHSYKSFSNPSGPMDFLKSAGNVMGAATALNAIL